MQQGAGGLLHPGILPVRIERRHNYMLENKYDDEAWGELLERFDDISNWLEDINANLSAIANAFEKLTGEG